MSDNSHSTGSSGSSTNSWTLLTPEEAAVESLGPVDDGTESLGDVPSLSEEVAGATAEMKPSEIAIETILSEEGHQVCQETSPEAGEGPIPSSPICTSPALTNTAVIPDDDLESQPPVIHDIVTSSPGDYEHLGATPFLTNLDLGEQVHNRERSHPEFDVALSPPYPDIPKIPVSVEPVLDVPADAESVSESPLLAEPISATEAAVGISPESDPPPCVDVDISPLLVLERPEPSAEVEVAVPGVTVPGVLGPDISVQESTTPERSKAENTEPDIYTSVGPQPETVGPTEETAMQKVETELHEKVPQIEEEEAAEGPSSTFSFKGDTSSDDDGLRRRHVQSFEAPRPRTSDEEDEEVMIEFELKIAEKREKKQGLSLTKCIVGALVLLCLGSLFLSDDSSEFGEQNENWPTPHDMDELLDKLEQENEKISQLEAQLQVLEDLDKENAKMKDELSSLPGLKEELETLRARVNEFTRLADDQDVQITTPKSPSQPAETDQKAAAPQTAKGAKDGGRLEEELHRQKLLLEESRQRLEKMKGDGGRKKGVRDGLEEIQKSLSEQVEKFGKKKPWESKWHGNSGREDPEQRRKQDREEKTTEGDRRNGKDGGKQDKAGDRREKDRKSHKEAWRRHQDEWDGKKDERRVDREQRKQEKPWHGRPNKDPHGHSHQHQHQSHQHQEPRQYDHEDFWKHQEEKLRRRIQPKPACTTAEDCASKEGLYPVELSEFEELLEGYLSKLEWSPPGSREAIRKLTARFFADGVFIHDRVHFSDFAEDVADILEDMADILEEMGQGDDDILEEEMEEFEREALWKFSATA